jgi:hypothetical protein
MHGTQAGGSARPQTADGSLQRGSLPLRTLDLGGELAEATGLQRLAPRWARSVEDSYIFFQSPARSNANAAR